MAVQKSQQRIALFRRQIRYMRRKQRVYINSFATGFRMGANQRMLHRRIFSNGRR